MDAGPWIIKFREANRAAIIEYCNEENGTAQGLIMPIMISNPEEKEKERQSQHAKLSQAYQKAQDRKEKETAEMQPE